MDEMLEKDWSVYAQKTLKREMGKALVSPIELSKSLGITHDAFLKRMRRASFSAGFFLQALYALGTDEIKIMEIKRREEEGK